MAETRGRYADEITPNLWVKSWRGWRYVQDVETDSLGMVTVHFTDGTSTTVRPTELMLCSDDHP